MKIVSELSRQTEQSRHEPSIICNNLDDSTSVLTEEDTIWERHRSSIQNVGVTQVFGEFNYGLSRFIGSISLADFLGGGYQFVTKSKQGVGKFVA